MSDLYCDECVHPFCCVMRSKIEAKAALATSQADVTRLAAELADSARALAVSQGEVDRFREEVEGESGIRVRNAAGWAIANARLDDIYRIQGERDEARHKATRLRGDLERARRALAELKDHLGYVIMNSTFCGRVIDWVTVNRIASRGLAPPATTASPEPDRGPEVTVKENDR